MSNYVIAAAISQLQLDPFNQTAIAYRNKQAILLTQYIDKKRHRGSYGSLCRYCVRKCDYILIILLFFINYY
ncbi:hypothetical protein [Nostoc sp.]|uniref:hypothetical protein n=1 Tax=Nostoc sp. TaxID=1180 RepID=UPI002FF78C40